MLIEAGFDIAFDCPAQTPMLLQLNVHPSREPDLLSPDPIVPIRRSRAPMSICSATASRGWRSRRDA